ncbi:unnamed protein product [Caenorhabditis brenneri]
MSFFGYISSVVNIVSQLITDVSTIAQSYANTSTEAVQSSVQEIEQPSESEPPVSIHSENSEEQENSNNYSKIHVEDDREVELDEFDMLKDYDQYVILYEHERGIDTEENFFIDLEESTRYH